MTAATIDDMGNSSAWVSVAVLLVGLGPAAAQMRLAPPRLPGESPRAALRLAEAQQLVSDGRFAEAIEEYQRLIDEAGDDLLPIDPKEPSHLVPLRRLCHLRLAALPAAGLQLYRGRVDPQAKKLLDQGRDQRDPRLLQRLVVEAFCSRHTDQALDLLGDLAFERGDFEAALRYWQMLAPVSKDALALVYPDPQVDLAQVRAKQLLARWCQGERRDAEQQLAVFRKVHGQAEGFLAGRKGNYADILTELAKQVDPASAVDDSAWPTFAGSPSRQRILAAAPRCRWLDEPWRAKIDGAAAPAANPVRTPTQAAQALIYHPVIVQDRVLLADARGVTCYDLWTGQRLSRWDLVEDLKVAVKLDDKLALAQGVRHTLTAVDGRAYVRLGELAVGQRKGESYLVCLDLGGAKPSLCWHVKLEAPEEGMAFFEGSPVVRDGRVYIAWTRFTQARALTGVDCYDADTGGRRWRQEISETREAADMPRHRHQLLTLAGPNVVCCTHAGAVVALDQQTGKRAWAIRYPRRGYLTADGLPTPRDLAPALTDAGRVYIAPADSDRVTCLDAVTGRPLWESRPVEVVHLLGVAKDRLIFTTGNAPRGIRALEASTGLDLREWIQPDDGHSELPGLGRGLLAGDKVFWPTTSGWRILRQEDGRLSRDDFVPLAGLPAGNLASASRCLIVATDRELIGYVPPARLLEPRRKQAAAQPGSALEQYRLALAEADAGQAIEALRSFSRAARLAEGSDLRDQAARQQQRVVNDVERLKLEIDVALANRPEPWLLLQIVAQQARLREREDPRQGVHAWQRILGAALIRDETYFDSRGIPSLTNVYVAQRIDSLVSAHGAALYDEFEKQAKALAGGRNEEADLLDQLWREYPNAAETRRRLRDWVQRCEAAGKNAEAGDGRRRLLALPADPQEAAANLAGLADNYQRRQLWDAARATWLRLRNEHGDQQAIGQLATIQLRKPELSTRNPLPRLGDTVAEVWQATLAGDRLLAVQAGDVFFVRDNQLVCRSAATGAARWSRRLATPILWLDRHGDILLAAGPRLVARLQADHGAVVWKLDAGPHQLSDFQLAGGRLFFLQDQGRLLALDVETGGIAWHADAAGSEGRFLTPYHAGEAWVAIQSANGRCQVIEARSGRRGPDLEARLPWPQPPVAVGHDRLAFASDRRQIALIDLAAAKLLWQHRLDRPTSLTGEPPQFAVRGNALIVLVPRNHAAELLRLDLATGKPIWLRPILHGKQAVQLERACLDTARLFLVADGTLQAISLASGKPLWSAALPNGESAWRVTATRNLILAHPQQAQVRMDTARTYRRLLLADRTVLLPTVGPAGLGHALARITTRTFEAQAPSRFVVLAFDPVTGQQVRQLEFEGRGPQADVAVVDGMMMVTTSDKVWAFR